ncbi:MAG: CPXCG motif-containing cysteine-rich protein [Bdellovibrionales bacterium GWA2_49_15]|nr:MAG: CPXCG motif-containing cysteine-rich protein [Bdellovibrionales bacterium GWA2_49_15]HAZ13437.1 CPXCG motif-containing cysteine-rich protein [Bdellovibrionales bacterium]
MQGEEEYFFNCPYCSSPISVVIETTLDNQEYIEDCEVCCKPIQIKFKTEEGEVTEFEATTLED